MHKILNFLFLLVVLYSLISCRNHIENNITWKPDDGYISNENSAIKMAEIVWLNVYGSDIEKDKPFKAHLENGKIWIVEGTLESNRLGGIPYIEIQKSDGKILKVTHGK